MFISHNLQQVIRYQCRATSMIIRYLSCGLNIYRRVTAHSYPISLYLKPIAYISNGSCTAARRVQCHRRTRLLHTTAVSRLDMPGMWVVRKVGNYINNDPLTKISLIFGGGLLAFLLLLEFLTSLKKKKPIWTVNRPPKAMHGVVKLSNEIDSISQTIKALQQQSGLPVLFLTGPSGVGKTHLAYQYTEEFTTRNSLHLWLSGKPVVLFVDGSNEDQLLLTLREAAFSLGIKLEKRHDNPAFPAGQERRHSCLVVAEALKSNLNSSKVPWLMVVNDLGSSCSDILDSLQEGLEGTKNGALLVTAQSFFPGKFPSRRNLKIEEINNFDAVRLIRRIAPNVTDDDALRVAMELPKSMMAAALAGATVKIYSLLLEQHGYENPTALSLDKYVKLLGEDTCEDHKMDRLVALYLEAASSYDPRLKHGFDFIASFGSVPFPIPVSSIDQHLHHPFYALPPPTANVPAHPLPNIELPANDEPDDDAAHKTLLSTVTLYFKQLKTVLDFRKSNVLPNSVPQSALDNFGILKESPLLTFQSQVSGGMETVRIHSAAFPQLCTQFVTQTVPQLDSTHLKQAEERFNKTAWFKSYRSFDSSQALKKYLCSLPGVSSPGVATEEGFKKNQDKFAAALCHDVVGCKPKERGLTYTEYLHLVSHYHRVTESLNHELKSATGDLEDTRLKVFLKPLFKQLSQYPLLSTTDRLICQSAMNSIDATITTDYADQLKCFESILDEQRQLFGSKSLGVAQTLTEMADQKYSMQDLQGAKQLLEEAVSIHKCLQSTPAGRNKHFLDYGLTLSSLGIVYSALGEHQLSKSYLEQALATYQTLPDDGVVTKRQRKLVASTLIDLSHAYLTLGQLVVAKKHVELAVDAARSVYGKKHPELARALNVKSIAYAMMGDREGSRKLRQEAGTVLGHMGGQPA